MRRRVARRRVAEVIPITDLRERQAEFGKLIEHAYERIASTVQALQLEQPDRGQLAVLHALADALGDCAASLMDSPHNRSPSELNDRIYNQLQDVARDRLREHLIAHHDGRCQSIERCPYVARLRRFMNDL